MEITINGNVTINNESVGATQQKRQGGAGATQQDERQPIDRTSEALIDNATSFNGLMDILMGKAEVAEAAKFEAGGTGTRGEGGKAP